MVDFVDDSPFNSIGRANRFVNSGGAVAAREKRSAQMKDSANIAEGKRKSRAASKRDKALETQAAEAVLTRKLSQRSLSDATKDRVAAKTDKERTKRVVTKRHKQQIDTLEKIDKSIRRLANIMMWGGGGLLGDLGGGLFGGGGRRGKNGRRLPRRDPRTGRFIKGAARGAGGLGVVGRLGLVGAAAAGGYFSTQSIMDSKGKGFFEGGLGSRAAGYLGNTVSGAAAGAAIGSVIPGVGNIVGGVIGAGVGLIGSIYADFSEEINTWIGKRWKDIKKLGGKFGKGVASLWSSTKTFWQENQSSIVSAASFIPGVGVVTQYFQNNPNAVADAWKATQDFFTVTLPAGVANWRKSLPTMEGVSTFFGNLGTGLNNFGKDVSKSTGDAFSGAKTALTINSPIAFSPEEGNFRSKLKYYRGFVKGKNTETAMQSGLMNQSDRDIRSLIMKVDERIQILKVKEANAALFGGGNVTKIKAEIQELEGFRKTLVSEQDRRKNAINSTKTMAGLGVLVPAVRPSASGTSSADVGGTPTAKPSASALKTAKSFGEGAKAASPIIMEAAKSYGVDFGYMMATAARESRFEGAISAESTSATGLFQFTDRTWKGMVNKYGKEHGLTMEGRTDKRQSAIASALYTRDNADAFSKEFKRKPTDTDLYILHFFGIVDGIRFLKNHAKRPNDPAAPDFGNGGTFKSNGKSTVSAANPTIFYEPGFKLSDDEKGYKSVISGKPKTYKGVYAYFAGAGGSSISAAYTQEYEGFATNAMAAGGYSQDFEKRKTELAAGSPGQIAGAKFANYAISDFMAQNRKGKGATQREEYEHKARIAHVQKMIENGEIPESELYSEFGLMNTRKLLDKYGHGYVVPARVQDMAFNASTVPAQASAQIAARTSRNDRRNAKLDPDTVKTNPALAMNDTVPPENISFFADGGDGIAILNLKGM